MRRPGHVCASDPADIGNCPNASSMFRLCFRWRPNTDPSLPRRFCTSAAVILFWAALSDSHSAGGRTGAV